MRRQSPGSRDLSTDAIPVARPLQRQLAVCIGCGCDDDHACPGGCSWLRVDYDARVGVCSRCKIHALVWDKGDRRRRAELFGGARRKTA